MSKSAKQKLFSLLFEEGRELVNLKFFPGSDAGLTEEGLYKAAEPALRQLLERASVSEPPHSGLSSATLREMLPSL